MIRIVGIFIPSVVDATGSIDPNEPKFELLRLFLMRRAILIFSTTVPIFLGTWRIVVFGAVPVLMVGTDVALAEVPLWTVVLPLDAVGVYFFDCVAALGFFRVY